MLGVEERGLANGFSVRVKGKKTQESMLSFWPDQLAGYWNH